MTREEELEIFYSFLSKNFNDIRKKYKQFCFLNHMDFNDDTLQDTIVKVADLIMKKGLKDKTEKGIERLFFYGIQIQYLPRPSSKPEKNDR